jgi:thiamine-monophosphate kinase
MPSEAERTINCFLHTLLQDKPFLDMTQIGIVEEGEGVFLDGAPLEAQGFDHFKS